MAVALRQRDLFVAEDWRVIYRAFTEVNFAAYDFDTIRSSMVDYIRLNFPEDFNDWIESSEFVALIELFAYLGQSLSFRTDLNTRENFLDTAERRESVLKLSRMLSFPPSRNLAANGLAKVVQISTDQPIVDSNGLNLSNKTIRWDDANNPDWFEQFILILNAIFNNTNPFGKPAKTGLVNGIKTESYTLNNDPSVNRVFPFSVTSSGQSFTFEVINPDFTDDETFFEKEPDPLDSLNLIFRNDGKGNASANTGFFVLFKQGTLKNEDFKLTIPIENRVIDLAGININNTDVFVQEIDDNGFIITKWDKVPATVGNNIIFNSIERNKRDIFSVITRPNDQISIRFADGRFGNVPTGIFRIWYRESSGVRFTTKPEDMRNIRLDISYFDGVSNELFTAGLTFSLQESVANSVPSQTSARIKEIAPQIYYTQDRMVNGEDYNVFPLQNPEAARIKAVNRIHSGFSRHIDINDPTGKNQNVNLFAEDGIIYFDINNSLQELSLPTILSDQEIIEQVLLEIVQKLERRQFFLFHFPRFIPSIQPITAIAGVTGIPGATLAVASIGSDSIIINGVTVALTTGITVDNVVTDIVAANIPNVLAQNDGGALRIDETSSKNLILEEDPGNIGVPLPFIALGIAVGTIAPRRFGTFWRNATNAVNSSSGRLFIDVDNTGIGLESPIKVSTATAPTNSEFHIAEGALIKFNIAGWVSVISIIGDGDTILANGNGSILLGENVPDEDFIEFIIPAFRTTFTELETTKIIEQLSQKNSFGLRFNHISSTWEIITGDNLDVTSDFSFTNTGDVTGLNLDSSWLVRIEFNTTNWRFISRGLDYVFESVKQVRFFNSETTKIVDPLTGKTEKDFIKILKVNSTLELVIELIGTSIATFTPGETIIINDIPILLDEGSTLADVVIDINAAFPTEIVVADIRLPGGEIRLKSNSVIKLAENTGETAVVDLGFSEGTFVEFEEATPCDGIGVDIIFNVEAVFKESDGFVDPRKLKVTFTDTDEDGVPDDPTLFEVVTLITGQGDNTLSLILPNNELDITELFWESFINVDGFQEFQLSTMVKNAFNIEPSNFAADATPDAPIVTSGPIPDQDVFYFRDTGNFYRSNTITSDFDLVTTSFITRRGRDKLLFQWKHFAASDERIDPAITNIIDIFVLTTSYDIEIRRWIDDNGAADEFPTPPTNQSLRQTFSSEIDNKMLSDEMIFHPVKYKLLFGVQSDETLQAKFKVTKVPGTDTSDGEIKARIIRSFNEFFAINNWDFGETFYFTELAAFVHQRLATIIGSIVLVPLDEEQKFGELFQVRSAADEVFISTAKVSDIQIVEAFNDNILRIGN